jgi:outer membrane protein TolC
LGGILAGWAIGLSVAGAENLDEAWQTALATDQRIQAARQRVAAANFSVEAAQRGYRPSIVSETGYTFLTDSASFRFGGNDLVIFDDNFPMTSLMAKMPVYTGGRITSAVDAASCMSNAAGSNVERTQLDVKLAVASAYVMVLRARRSVDVAKAKVRSLEAQEKVVQTMLQRGEVPRNDLLAVQVELANARQDEVRAENKLANAEATYNRLLGRPLNTPVELVELRVPEASADVEVLVARALRMRPELSALSAQANALRHQATGEKAATMPQLGVEGGLLYLESPGIRPNTYGTLMLGLEWTPYDGGVARAKANSLLSQAASVSRTRADTTAAVRLAVQNAWRDEQESRTRIELATKALEQADENLRTAKVRFQKGAAINTEVLDAESLRTRTYNNYYDAIYEAILATYRLRRAVGSL